MSSAAGVAADVVESEVESDTDEGARLSAVCRAFVLCVGRVLPWMTWELMRWARLSTILPVAPVPIASISLAEDDEFARAVNDVHVDLEAVLKPREIVAELGRHIVGQEDAKRAVAIALRSASLHARQYHFSVLHRDRSNNPVALL
jgi:hypothetical protein